MEYKQVIVLRADLDMSRGKLAAQACHACLGVSERARKRDPEKWEEWLEEGGRKIVLKVSSERELFEIKEDGKALGIDTYLVKDRGLTEIPSGTVTALGLGPGEESRMDRVTGDLSLLK